jgi:hypothetical protein
VYRLGLVFAGTLYFAILHEGPKSQAISNMISTTYGAPLAMKMTGEATLRS